MVWRFALANVNHGVPLRSGCANAVLANQVIEHIADPEHFAKEIYRILQPHGMAVITTPNIRYVKHLWKLVVLGQGLKTSDQNEGDGSWDDGHIHYFTHNDLYSIFMAAGFKRVESQALVDQRGALPRLRVIFDHLARVYPVREFLSGNILVVATR
jgi:predicted SAM-dependent methyltransferase